MKIKLKIPRPQINLREGGRKFGSGVRNATMVAKNRLHVEQVGKVDRLLATISYLFFTGLLIRLFKKNRSQFLEYHTRQSIVLFVLLTFLLLVPQYGVTVFGPIILLLMVVSIVVGVFGGTVKLLPKRS